ncbi:hypothetical protein PIROE2DRAFT_11891 [Piromyces sp. E2]|nr:hypothetical protein PIROE2DRAFT_11891 [Piromyces sp. E2]|eukprot:OUM61963.1 hypothetical protein PIROE2DRAFT_11891 [Piromyces sp. E2]
MLKVSFLINLILSTVFSASLKEIEENIKADNINVSLAHITSNEQYIGCHDNNCDELDNIQQQKHDNSNNGYDRCLSNCQKAYNDKG